MDIIFERIPVKSKWTSGDSCETSTVCEILSKQELIIMWLFKWFIALKRVERLMCVKWRNRQKLRTANKLVAFAFLSWLTIFWFERRRKGFPFRLQSFVVWAWRKVEESHSVAKVTNHTHPFVHSSSSIAEQVLYPFLFLAIPSWRVNRSTILHRSKHRTISNSRSANRSQ